MEYLTELNDLQLQAVTTKSKKVLVIAGAGSGKTKVLTTRIKYLLDNKENRNQILAFTFTKKAAKEMKDRLDDYKFDNVYTFHSYCYQYIVNNPRFFGFKKDDIYVIDDNYKEYFINNIINDMNLRINIKLIISYISKRKNGIDVTFDNSKDESIYNQIYFKYQEYLCNACAIDFDDMVPLFIKYFDTLPFKYEILNNAKYILVDECQDTNQIQYDLVKLLAQTHKNIFMVGDDKQLIYSFRSSDIKIINDFKDNCDEVIPLKQNYRSASNILDVANKLIKNNHHIYKNEIYSLIPKKYDVRKVTYESTIHEANGVAYVIDRLIKQGVEPKDIAILYRNNYQSNQLELALTYKKIPYVVYGKLPFYQMAESKRIISAYRFIKNPDDSNLFIYLLPKNDLKLIDDFRNRFKESNKNILEFAINYENEIIRKTALGLKEIIETKSGLTKIDKFDFIYEALFQDDINTKRYAHVKLLMDIITSSEIQDECEIINEILVNEDTDDKVFGVRLLTIHKAKGLEFKYVFIISLNDGILPKVDATDEQLEEERRLFYVAITRARYFLQISSAGIHYINNSKKSLRQSVFMCEIK